MSIGRRAAVYTDEAHVEPEPRINRVAHHFIRINIRSKQLSDLQCLKVKPNLKAILQIDYEVVLGVPNQVSLLPGQTPEVSRQSFEQHGILRIRQPRDIATQSSQSRRRPHQLAGGPE